MKLPVVVIFDEVVEEVEVMVEVVVEVELVDVRVGICVVVFFGVEVVEVLLVFNTVVLVDLSCLGR